MRRPHPQGSVLLALDAPSPPGRPQGSGADGSGPKDLLLSGFVIYNLVGDRTAYSFSNLKINPATTPEMFAYEPPVDYRMVDHRPLPSLKDAVNK